MLKKRLKIARALALLLLFIGSPHGPTHASAAVELFFPEALSAPQTSPSQLEFDITDLNRQSVQSILVFTDKAIMKRTLQNVEERLLPPCFDEYTETESRTIRTIGQYGAIDHKAHGHPFLGSSAQFPQFTITSLAPTTGLVGIDTNVFLSDVYVTPLNSPYPSGFRFFKHTDQDAIYLEREDIGKDFYPPGFTLDGAIFHRSGPFIKITMGRGLAIVLLEATTKRILVTSFADYNDAKIDVVAHYTTPNESMYLVAIGEKAMDAHGLLRHRAGTWTLDIAYGENALQCD